MCMTSILQTGLTDYTGATANSTFSSFVHCNQDYVLPQTNQFTFSHVVLDGTTPSSVASDIGIHTRTSQHLFIYNNQLTNPTHGTSLGHNLKSSCLSQFIRNVQHNPVLVTCKKWDNASSDKLETDGQTCGCTSY